MNGRNKFKNIVECVTRTAGDIWMKGWAERNAGNISVRLHPDETPEKMYPGEWKPIGIQVKSLAETMFLVTGTGQFLRNVPLAPKDTLGVIEVCSDGSQYRVIWGLQSGCAPTSELPSHLLAHEVRTGATGGVDRVIVHTHTPNLIALTYALDLDTKSLTRLLWEMHTECLVVFPDGCGLVKWLMPGSAELASATAEIFKKRSIAVWEHHGAMASGPDLDMAFGLIDTAEKTAGIYIKVASMGPVRNRLSTQRLRALSVAFDLTPDAVILGEDE